MGSSKATKDVVLFDAETMGADITSAEIDVNRMDYGCINISWDNTGVPIGVFRIEVTNQDGASANWQELSFGEDIVVPSVAPDELDQATVVFNLLPFKKLRLFYDRTSGTGTMSAVLSEKSVGV